MQENDKRRRRRHSGDFKSEAVAACQVPGASVSGVALERQINANLLRRWIKEAVSQGAVVRSAQADTPERQPAFVPVGISKPSGDQHRPIRVQVRRRSLRVTIEWPATQSGVCAAWLKELLG